MHRSEINLRKKTEKHEKWNANTQLFFAYFDWSILWVQSILEKRNEKKKKLKMSPLMTLQHFSIEVKTWTSQNSHKKWFIDEKKLRLILFVRVAIATSNATRQCLKNHNVNSILEKKKLFFSQLFVVSSKINFVSLPSAKMPFCQFKIIYVAHNWNAHFDLMFELANKFHRHVMRLSSK